MVNQRKWARESRLQSNGVLALVLLLCVFAPLRESHSAEVSFRNDVMPALSKAGCNSGPCHGNANGKGGFKLSLRGDYAEDDFKALTRDQFSRRVNSIDPGKSLILLKPTNELSHQGGKRFEKDSWEYRAIHDWIADGMKGDPEKTPQLETLTVTPSEQIVIQPENSVQIRAVARFSDGSEKDVTTMAVYETSNDKAVVSAAGLARSETTGETTVLVRFLNRQAPVRLAFVPERPGFAWQSPKENNFIDRHVFAKLRRFRMNPSAVCSDEVFVRRAWLDLLGLIPTADEARAFVSDKGPGKRAKLVDRLLERPEFADYWAMKWADILRNEERSNDRKGARIFNDWIRQSIAENKSLDQFARELIAARGGTYENPPANYYRVNRASAVRAEAAAQAFLGVRLQCAQCHNHPFDRWTQDDYYDWTTLFSRVDYKIIDNRRRDKNDKHEFAGEQWVYMSRKGGVKNPRTGESAKPRFLGVDQSSLKDGDDYLVGLSQWLTAPDNRMFARAQVNRIWHHLLGRGLVDPIDDFRATNPPSHPALMEELADDFVKQGFDLRRTIRAIMASSVYQLSSEPNATNASDEINFSHAYVRRHDAEVALDLHSQVTGVRLEFEGNPVGTRAAQLASSPSERRRRSEENPLYDFLHVFGKPARLIPSECERSCEPTMGQTFQMISGRAVDGMITRGDNRLKGLLAKEKSDEAALKELFWTALTREPTREELDACVSRIGNAKDRRAGFEDVLWGLLNAKEFILRR